MNVEQRLDLRHSSRGAQVAEVKRIDTQRTRIGGFDHGLERALLDAVLRERRVFGQQVIARRHDRPTREQVQA